MPGEAQSPSFHLELSEDDRLSPSKETRKKVLMAFVHALQKADFLYVSLHDSGGVFWRADLYARLTFSSHVPMPLLVHSNASPAQISSFTTHFALTLILLTTVIKPEPPNFPTTISSLSKSQLLELTADCQTVPAGVISAACSVYKFALPTKVKKTLLDGTVLMLERLYATETDLAVLESKWTDMIKSGLRDKDRSVRLASG